VQPGPFEEQQNSFSTDSKFTKVDLFGQPISDPSAAVKRSLKPSVAEASPGLYAAGSRINLTREERNLIETWSTVKGTHEKLMAMDNKKAAEAFSKLDPEWQGIIQAYYKVDYANKPNQNMLIEDPAKRKLLGLDNGLSVGDVFKSPFRFIFSAADQYTRLYNAPYTMLQETAINREDFWTRSNFDASFDGDFSYDDREAEKLVNKHGRELSFVAMHLLAGKTPGEIIDSWGPNDGAILEAMSTVFNDPDKMTSVMDEFDRTRLSPGRNVARWVNKKFDISAEEHPDWFSKGSGSIDFAFQIFGDPLTYVTAGVSNFGKVARLTRAIKNGNRDIVEHFADPSVVRYFSGYGEKIGEYQKAIEAKDATKAGQLKQEISGRYKMHGTDQEIDFWAKKGVVDFDTFKNQFTGDNPENFAKLISGRVSGVAFSKESAAIARPWRELTLRSKESIRDFFTGKPKWDELDETATQKLLDDLNQGNISEVEKVIQQEGGNLVDKARKALTYQFSLHPGFKGVFVTDEKVVDTLDIVRQQANLAFKDKTLAHLFTEHFRTATQQERISLKKNLDHLILRSTGMAGLPGGKQFLKNQLDWHYGDSITYGVKDKVEAPDAWGLAADRSADIMGPLQPSQMKDQIGALDYRGISEFVAQAQLSLGKGEKLTAETAARIIGGAYNHKITAELIDNWSVLTLFPQLGIRTAIDEGFFFGLTANFRELREFGRAQRYGNIFTAYTGSKEATGPIKNILQIAAGKLTGKQIGAPRSISQGQRDEIFDRKNQNRQKYDSEFDAEHAARLEVFALAAATKYGSKLTPEQIKHLQDLAMYNPKALSDSSALRILDATMNKQGLRGDNYIISKSNADKSLLEMDMVATGKYNIKSVQDMADAEVYTVMFNNFITRFSQKGFEIGGKYVPEADPARLFIANNGLETAQDLENATNQFLKAIGFEFNGNIWQVNNKNIANVKKFLESSTHFQKYDGLADVEKAKEFITDTFADLFSAFNGDKSNFNRELLEVFRPFINGWVKDHRQIVNRMDKNNEFTHPSGKTSIPSYRSLVENHKPKDSVITDLDFTYGLAANYRKYRDGLFEGMSRQTDDIYRSPAVQSAYIIFREEEKFREVAYAQKHARDLMAQGVDEADAIKKANDVASRFFTNRAIARATDRVLKYADNPDIRTVFAYNIRTVGRFYRAVEDFHRRLYRLVQGNKLNTIYRMRLLTTGLDSFGAVHEDPNGERYIILPMDDVIYGAVNGTLRMLTDGKVGIEQPLFNDITFNITAMNPSFQTDAGVPYLSGPAGSLSVLAVKTLLGQSDITANAAEDLDQWTLGTMGDNVDFRNSVTPKFVNNIWKMLSPDERDQQEVSAYVQALAYNQANGYGIDPTEYAGNKAGLDEAKRQYLQDVKISAHNIIVTRALLGMILPMSVQTKDSKDLPTYLKENGVVSMKSSYYEFLDQVKLSYPDAEDHYELALATWTGDNPGKIVYLVSTNQEGVKPLIKYSTEMQDWAIANKDAVEKYGNGALLFAPNTGEFTPGVYKWAEAAGIVNKIPGDKSASQYISDYYENVMLQEHANRYYDIGEEEENDIRSIPFSNVQARRSTLDTYDRLKQEIMLSVPGLDDFIKQGIDNSDATEFVGSAYNYVNTPGASVKPEVAQKINEAYEIYNEFIKYADYINTLDPSGAADIKRIQKDKAKEAIQKIIESDNSKTVEQFYKYGLLKLMNAKSRDAQPGIQRNIIKKTGN
jgi:hypothetical protein